MVIGTFGKNIIFETSDRRILTFNDFKRESSARYESHSRIGKKPRLEFIAPELDSITFTINLNSSLGIKVDEEILKWRTANRTGLAEELIINGQSLGYDKWVVKSISEAWNTVFNNGFLYSASLNISLEEYISD